MTSVVTKVPGATLNGVWATAPGARCAEIDAGLNEVGGTAGATGGWLYSTEPASRVYERLGFTTL